MKGAFKCQQIVNSIIHAKAKCNVHESKPGAPFCPYLPPGDAHLHTQTPITPPPRQSGPVGDRVCSRKIYPKSHTRHTRRSASIRASFYCWRPGGECSGQSSGCVGGDRNMVNVGWLRGPEAHRPEQVCHANFLTHPNVVDRVLGFCSFFSSVQAVQ